MHEHPERYSRQEVFDYARRMVDHDPEDPAALWRMARAAYDLS
jgi:hypothetical protein